MGYEDVTQMQKSPNIPPGMNQFQNQPQLVALQAAGFQHTQTSDSNSGVSQPQNSPQVLLLAAGIQSIPLSPNFDPSVTQNQSQHPPLQTAGFQSPEFYSSLLQAPPTEDQLVALLIAGFKSPEFYSLLLQILNRDQLVALLSAAFQHPEFYSSLLQIMNEEQVVALLSAAFQPPEFYSHLLQILRRDQLVALLSAAFQSTQVSSNVQLILAQTQNQDQLTAPQAASSHPDLHPAGGAGAESDNAANRDDVLLLFQDTHTLNDVGAKSDGGAAGGAEPLAPQDTAKVNIQVEWTEEIPDRWKVHLQKALQSWINGTQFQHVEECEVVNLQLLYDPRCAVVEISPSQALDVLMTLKKGTLNFRELKCHNTVHFLDKVPADIRTEPISKSQQSVPTVEENAVPEVKQKTGRISKEVCIYGLLSQYFVALLVEMSFKVDLDNLPQNAQAEIMRKFGSHWAGNKFLFSGSFDTVEKNYKEICKIAEASPFKMAAAAMRNDPHGAETPQHAERSGDPLTLTVPISHYWYLSQAFRQDLRQFEEQCGVSAEALVSFTAEGQSRKDSVQEAAQKFIDFYNQNTRSLASTEIPPTQLESEYGKEVVRHVQSDQGGLMLNLSAGQCQLFGPGPVISAVQKQMNLGSGMETGRSSSDDWANMETDFSNAEGRSWTSQTAKPVEMDIRDSPDSIVMSETHWKLIQKTSQKQIQDIEIKYGVLLTAAPSQGSVRVTVKSNSEHVNLESHALSAFTRLYQKVTTTAVACSLKRPAEGNTVAQALRKLGCPDYFVGIEEKNDSWKLVGLPKHLGPVITEIEKLVGKSVFDDKTKELVGYPGNFPESWGLRGGQQEVAAAKWTHGITPDSGKQAKNESGKDIKEKDDDKSKDDDCPICMDKFTDKKKLKCGHEFCRACLNESVKSMGEICPVCKNIFGKLIGTQPVGTMTVNRQSFHSPWLSSLRHHLKIVFTHTRRAPRRGHPNPGRRFYGAHRQAYLPDNVEGRRVLKLLQRAFDQRLIFTVGTSTTTGADNSVIWNDIHHKTNTSGGSQKQTHRRVSYPSGVEGDQRHSQEPQETPQAEPLPLLLKPPKDQVCTVVVITQVVSGLYLESAQGPVRAAGRGSSTYERRVQHQGQVFMKFYLVNKYMGQNTEPTRRAVPIRRGHGGGGAHRHASRKTQITPEDQWRRIQDQAPAHARLPTGAVGYDTRYLRSLTEASKMHLYIVPLQKELDTAQFQEGAKDNL
ncbi:hypothetical protein NFI96_019947, partial [Prochilodus magdalenae]